VHVGKDWRVRSDAHQWIVERRRKGAKAARHQWRPVSYWKTLDAAVVWCGRAKVMELPGEYGVNALPQLFHALDTILEEVRGAVAGLGPAEADAGARTTAEVPAKGAKSPVGA
jgi:hypothetical protein